MSTPAAAPSPGRPGSAAAEPSPPADGATSGGTRPGRIAPGPAADGQGWRAVSIVLIGAFMALLDYSVQVSRAS
jgi:hypothetical protein